MTVTSMNRIGDHAAYYRAYLTSDASLAPVAGILAVAAAMGLFFYLLSLVGPYKDRTAPRLAAPAVHATAPVANR